MRLIDADKLKGQLRGHYSGVVGYVDEDDIDAAPTVDLYKWQAEGEPGMVKAQRERAEKAEAEVERLKKLFDHEAAKNFQYEAEKAQPGFLAAEVGRLTDDVEWLIDTLDFNLQQSGFAQQALDARHATQERE